MERPTLAEVQEPLDTLAEHLGRVSGWNQVTPAQNAEPIAAAVAVRPRAVAVLRAAGHVELASHLETLQLPAPCPLWIVRPARGLEYLSAQAALRAVAAIRQAATVPGAPVPEPPVNYAEQLNASSVWWLPGILLGAFVVLSLTVGR